MWFDTLWVKLNIKLELMWAKNTDVCIKLIILYK